MRVRIHTTTKTHNGTQTVLDHHTYIASNPDECADEVDKFTYETAVEMGRTVTVGCVTAELID
jgi:hypothetical protein